MIGYKLKTYSIEDIKSEMILIEAERKKINDRRKDWINNSVEFITGFFEKTSDEINNKLIVEVVDNLKNLNSIIIGLKDNKSGIFERKEIGAVEFEYFSGSLGYSQTLNGNINVWIAPPYVIELMEAQPIVSVDSIAPKDLDQHKLYGHLYQFLEVVLEWESQDNIIGKLGYVQNKEENIQK